VSQWCPALSLHAFRANIARSASIGLVHTTHAGIPCLAPQKRRALSIISSQLGSKGVVWDIEYDNGTSFVFSRDEPLCQVLQFDQGLMQPDWLRGASLLGEVCGGRATHEASGARALYPVRRDGSMELTDLHAFSGQGNKPYSYSNSNGPVSVDHGH